MLRVITVKKKPLAIFIELIIFVVYTLFAITTYRKTELDFTEGDMQLRKGIGR